jgi:hypothetical protein
MQGARSVLLILVLLAGSLSPPAVEAQEEGGRAPAEPEQLFYLEQNYPNPVNPETWFPFHLEEGLFRGRDSVTVSVRIFNPLGQVVAIPRAVEAGQADRPAILNLAYRAPGRKVAYWDGKDLSGRLVPSGVYYCQLVVDNRPQTRKLIVYNPRRRRNILPWFGKQKDRPQ